MAQEGGADETFLLQRPSMIYPARLKYTPHWRINEERTSDGPNELLAACASDRQQPLTLHQLQRVRDNTVNSTLEGQTRTVKHHLRGNSEVDRSKQPLGAGRSRS